jgi:hypothetical protein
MGFITQARNRFERHEDTRWKQPSKRREEEVLHFLIFLLLRSGLRTAKTNTPPYGQVPSTVLRADPIAFGIYLVFIQSYIHTYIHIYIYYQNAQDTFDHYVTLHELSDQISREYRTLITSNLSRLNLEPTTVNQVKSISSAGDVNLFSFTKKKIPYIFHRQTKPATPSSIFQNSRNYTRIIHFWLL